MGIQVGQAAPEIRLPDQDGVMHNLADYKNKRVLVYFYPEDDTPGCTKEACSFRDNLPRFENVDAVILGISTDSVASHKAFAQKFQLLFTLLSDENKVVSRAYGVLNDSGRDKRTSFLISPEGKVAKIYEQVNPEIHSQQIYEDLQQGVI